MLSTNYKFQVMRMKIFDAAAGIDAFCKRIQEKYPDFGNYSLPEDPSLSGKTAVMVAAAQAGLSVGRIKSLDDLESKIEPSAREKFFDAIAPYITRMFIGGQRVTKSAQTLNLAIEKYGVDEIAFLLKDTFEGHGKDASEILETLQKNGFGTGLTEKQREIVQTTLEKTQTLATAHETLKNKGPVARNG